MRLQAWLLTSVWLGLLVLGVGCAGSNPYGYGREYVVRDEEEPYFERSVELSYEEVRREPGAFASQMVGWFGMVTKVTRGPSGQVTVALDLRFHQPRHLCTDQFEDSCRVTVSDRAGGPFSTTFTLRSEDSKGPTRLNVGSLVKVYGSPTGEFDDRGGPVLKTAWYRQWPHGAYVTTRGHSNMRR
jgi:hypothetical protein